jgi:N-glycosylase/DNA lyase
MKVDIPSSDLKELESVLGAFKNYKTEEEIFYHLCFCILAPQTKFVNNKKAIEELKERGFYSKNLRRNSLERIVKKTRFYRNKARYLAEMKKIFPEIMDLLKSGGNPQEIRYELVNSIKGMGYKTSSHFLRNLGFEGLSIIDTHILKFLEIEKFPNSRKEYLTIEEKFFKVAKQNKLSPEILDAWIWKEYSNTEYENFDY